VLQFFAKTILGVSSQVCVEDALVLNVSYEGELLRALHHQLLCTDRGDSPEERARFLDFLEEVWGPQIVELGRKSRLEPVDIYCAVVLFEGSVFEGIAENSVRRVRKAHYACRTLLRDPGKTHSEPIWTIPENGVVLELPPAEAIRRHA
jgi:hypothetical protein